MVASVGPVLLVAFECTVAAATAPVRNGLSGTYFDNAMLLPRDEAALEPCGRVDRLSDLATMNASALPCGGAAVFSARWDGVFAPGFFEDGMSYDLALSANVPVRLWVRTWKLVDVWTNGGQHGTTRERLGRLLHDAVPILVVFEDALVDELVRLLRRVPPALCLHVHE